MAEQFEENTNYSMKSNQNNVFSHVQLVTSWTVAHQTPRSMEFSR